MDGLLCESILPSGRKLLVISNPDNMASKWPNTPPMCYGANVIDIYDENQECEGIEMPCYFGPIGTMLEQDQAIICGSLKDPSFQTDGLHPREYPFNCTLNGVKNFTNLKYSHHAGSALNINGSTLWITGGNLFPISTEMQSETDLVPSTKSEFINKYGSEQGPNLPRQFMFHCATKANLTHAILTGGFINSDYDMGTTRTTLFVDLETFMMTEGPKMIVPRSDHACGGISHPNGTNYVLVGGGVHQGEIPFVSSNEGSTELLKIGQDSGWSMGPTIPNDCIGGSMLTTPDGLGIIFTGCIDHQYKQNYFSQFNDNIYHLFWKENALQWKILKQKLNHFEYRVLKSVTSTMWIPNELTKCHQRKCNVDGICSGGEILLQIAAKNVADCTKMCRKSSYNCSWTTFDPKKTKNCMLFKSCPKTKVSYCKGCITNEKNCSCHVKGECVGGYFIGKKPTIVLSECDKLCDEDKRCKWSTFDKILKICYKFASCQTLQFPSCKYCETFSKDCNYPIPYQQ